MAHAASPTNALPALPLALRFPPALSGDPDDCETPEDIAEAVASISRDLPILLPLMTLDGAGLVAHLAAMTPEARAALGDTATNFHSHGWLLDWIGWPLSCRLSTLTAYLDVEAGGLLSDPLDNYDETRQTPEGSRRRVLLAAAQAWGENDRRDDHDPMLSMIGGKRHRYYPEVDIKPFRTTYDGARGWAVPVGPNPDNPTRWAFVPEDRAVGAPELAAVVEG